MIRRTLIAVVATAAVAFVLMPSTHAFDKPRPYPPAPTADVVDTYHGVAVRDPYRPLEDPDSPESRKWIEAQNKLTFAFLEGIPAREQIKRRLTELWDYEKLGVPFVEGGRYFYTRNTGLQNQSVLYWADDPDAAPHVLLDPNTLSADGTVALTGTNVSDDGRLLAYGLASAGSDWQEWRVRDVATGKDHPDVVRWVKFSDGAWTKDGRGFYYGRFPEPAPGQDLKGANYFHKLYYHELGTPQSDDRVVYERPDEKEWGFGGEVTDDGRYLIITVWRGADPTNRVLYKDLAASPDAPPVELIGHFEHEFDFVDNDGPVFWFKTNHAAPRNRVVAIDTREPSTEKWREVVPQAAETLEAVDLVGGHFFASYLKDARSQVKVFDERGTFVREIELPGLGSVEGFSGKRSDPETFFSFTSYTTPTTIYRHEVATGKSTVFRQPKVNFKSDEYETRQVFFTSKDGTRVPMFLTHKKGLTLDGNNPTLLYGYGGFNVSVTPWFSPSYAVWLERGGVLAIPNLRGGGEYGREWHDAGRKANKQNVFDDFIAAAEWLIANKVTSTAKLAIEGGSNGGLLVGACMTQRPELFGAVVPAVGVLDMLRFHRFTIGWGWVEEYGSADAADAAQFKALYGYSPLHNVKPGTCYPPTLIVTADHDDRVVPAHSFKFAAALQAAQACENPILIRIETKAGHGAGKPTSKRIEEAADKWAFLVKVLGVE